MSQSFFRLGSTLPERKQDLVWRSRYYSSIQWIGVLLGSGACSVRNRNSSYLRFKKHIRRNWKNWSEDVIASSIEHVLTQNELIFFKSILKLLRESGATTMTQFANGAIDAGRSVVREEHHTILWFLDT